MKLNKVIWYRGLKKAFKNASETNAPTKIPLQFFAPYYQMKFYNSVLKDTSTSSSRPHKRFVCYYFRNIDISTILEALLWFMFTICNCLFYRSFGIISKHFGESDLSRKFFTASLWQGEGNKTKTWTCRNVSFIKFLLHSSVNGRRELEG